MRGAAGYHRFNFVEQAVGLGRGGPQGFIATFLLFQVGYHDGGIQSAFSHLVQVDLQLGVAGGEVDALVKEHGSVAVRVEGKDAVVDAFGSLERGGLVNQPAEQGQHAFVVFQDEAFGMPLDPQHRVVGGRFDAFDDAIGSPGSDAEAGSRLLHGLVVEGVDRQTVGVEQLVQQRTGLQVDRVRGKAAVQVLVVLDAGPLHLDMDVLVQASSQGCIQHLDASANTQYRHLAVGCQSGEQQLLAVAPGIDAVKLLDRFFAPVERIDVGPSCEQESVDAVEAVGQSVGVVARGKDEGDAACFQNGSEVAFQQCAGSVLVVAGESDDRGLAVPGQGMMYAVVLTGKVKGLNRFHTLKCC